MRRREFLVTAAAALALPVSRLSAAAPSGTCSTSRSPASATTSSTAASACSSTTSAARLQVRQAHSDLGRRRPGRSPRTSRASPPARRPAGSTSARSSGIGCIDLVTEKMVWDKELEGGCDRMAISPDGATLYVPSFEGPHWNVVNAQDGSVITKIVTELGRAQHRSTRSTARTPTWPACARRCCRSPTPGRTPSSRPSGRSATSIRPFTVNAAQTLCYVNVNELLGFEVGDITHRQEAASRRGARATSRGRSSGTAARATASA